jgi:hypothetical protein
MKMKMVIIVLALIIGSGAAFASCDSIASASIGDWKSLNSAPHDGTVVEVLNTYGLAPTYGLFKYVKADKWWQDVRKANQGIVSEVCMYFRPYNGTVSAYVDPTGGAQDSVAYWCAYAHRPYNKKTGYCE